MLTLNYKFRLYPNKLYEKRLESNLEACRFLYNHFIEEGYDDEYEMNRRITELKDSYPYLSNYYSKMLQMVSKKVSSIRRFYFTRISCDSVRSSFFSLSQYIMPYII